MKHAEVLVVGASIAGLASAGALHHNGIDYIIIEKESEVAVPWRRHYDRLHLHTNKRISNLPYKKFDKSISTYPGKQQVIEYLEAYQLHFNIRPVFSAEANSIRREKEHWITETNSESYSSKYLVIATGPFGTRRAVNFNGAHTFEGPILHSADYKTGKDFKGKLVLVVGFGNSACEIAIDLYEQGAQPCMSVRSPVNVIPRDIAGVPILELSLLLGHLPPGLADALSAPLIRLAIGDIGKLGIQKKTHGPFQQIKEDGTIPVLDTGIIKHLKQDHIPVFGPIDHIEGNNVKFENGKLQQFDAIIAAIGYDAHFPAGFEIDQRRIDDLKHPVAKQQYFGTDGLYFCGFWVGPTGQIREIGLDAKKIAADIHQSQRAKPTFPAR